MNIAVVGSRKGVSPDRVAAFVAKLWDRYGREAVLVSGGADGVDRVAEATWQALGGEVHSYRIKNFNTDITQEDSWGIEVWMLASGENRTSFIYHPGDQPRFANAASALTYRTMLIAEKADRGVAFWDGRSRGTALCIDSFYAEKKPIHVFREEASDGAQS